MLIKVMSKQRKSIEMKQSLPKHFFLNDKEAFFYKLGINLVFFGLAGVLLFTSYYIGVVGDYKVASIIFFGISVWSVIYLYVKVQWYTDVSTLSPNVEHAVIEVAKSDENLSRLFQHKFGPSKKLRRRDWIFIDNHLERKSTQ